MEVGTAHKLELTVEMSVAILERVSGAQAEAHPWCGLTGEKNEI